MRHRPAFKFAAVMGALVAALLGIELLLRSVGPQQLSGTWLTTSAGGYELNRAGAVARHVHGALHVSYSINALGLRGPAPSATGKRVLVLGDSVTFGWLIDEPRTYVSRLQAAADDEWGPGRVDFLNAAVGGWGLGEYAAFLEDQGDKVRPDAILIFLSGAEPVRAVESGLWQVRDAGGLRRIPQSAIAKRTIHSINRLPGYSWLITRSQAANLVRRTVIEAMMSRPGSSSESEPAHTSKTLRLTEALHDRVLAWTTGHGIPLWVVGTGFVESEAGTNVAPGANRRFLETASVFFQRRGVQYLDLWSRLGFVFDDPDRYRIRDDQHPNADAAAQVAKMAWPWLQELLTADLSVAR